MPVTDSDFVSQNTDDIDVAESAAVIAAFFCLFFCSWIDVALVNHVSLWCDFVKVFPLTS